MKFICADIGNPRPRAGKVHVVGPKIAANYVRGIADLGQEAFFCLWLDAQNRPLKLQLVSLGGLSATVVDPKVIARAGVLLGAASVIFIHNHPSGSTTPSKEDIDLTPRLAAGLKLLDITVLDHIIIGDKEHYSMKEAGLCNWATE